MLARLLSNATCIFHRIHVIYSISMKNLIIIFVLSLLSSLVHAEESLSAHVHGVVALDIAADSKEVLFIMKSPADSFLGFEHRPKTKKQMSKVRNVKKLWREDFNKLFKGLEGCKRKTMKWNLKYTGKSHSDIEAQAHIICMKPVKNINLSILLMNYFPNIEAIQLQLIRANGEMVSKKVKSKRITLKL